MTWLRRLTGTATCMLPRITWALLETPLAAVLALLGLHFLALLEAGARAEEGDLWGALGFGAAATATGLLGWTALSFTVDALLKESMERARARDGMDGRKNRG